MDKTGNLKILLWAISHCDGPFSHTLQTERAAHLSFCHTGRIRTHGIGGGHKQKYRWIDFQRLRYEPNKEDQPFEEKVVEVRYDPCRSDHLSSHFDEHIY